MSLSTDDTLGGKIFRLVIGRNKKTPTHGDPSREVFETVVFVVVLVLMLKLFVAEAFVIPTGSMASTLWGDQVKVECPECKHTYPVTAAPTQGGPRKEVRTSICQNCGHQFDPANGKDYNTGDRVLVAKYEYHIRPPKRFDVPVFKYPEAPYHAQELQAMNYIKRLIGLPGETIAIYKGDLYQTTDLKYPGYPEPASEKDKWMLQYTYPADPAAVAYFNAGQFKMVRKSPDEILVVRRLVFDLDQQPASQTGPLKTRWQADPAAPSGWTTDAKGFTHTGPSEGWVRYQHASHGWRAGTQPTQPVHITDYLAYNVTDHSLGYPYWAPDLMVECDATVGGPGDSVTLELVKAGERFKAVFAGGKCALYHVKAAGEEKLGEQATKITGPGKYALRFADFDARLTVWVDGRALTPVDVPEPGREAGSFKPSTDDLHQPARIGATGSVSVAKVKLYRDVYYTHGGPHPDAPNVEGTSLSDYYVQTYYVQPGHYLCLGDNSASSSDGRTWGLVPDRLMLGRAVWVYWPVSRFGKIE
ncbi:MAG TPA: S26 family signal peptidase [Gemmataceae bacterium]|nr:S26 family signal peptidase [Gemmataceae bacterium]